MSKQQQLPIFRIRLKDLALLVIMSGWIVGLTGVTRPGFWYLRKTLVEDGHSWSPLFLPLATLVLSVGVLVPAVLILWQTNTKGWQRAILNLWWWGALCVLFLMPVHWIRPNSTHIANFLQIFGLGLFLIIIQFASRKLHQRKIESSPHVIAFIIGPLLIVPWVPFGAFGSMLDIFLNLVVALLFGAVIGRLVEYGLYLDWYEHTTLNRQAAIFAGLAVSTTTLMLGAALGFNGHVIALTVLGGLLGWLILAVFHWQIGNNSPRRTIMWLVAFAVSGPLQFIDPDELTLYETAESVKWALFASALLIGLATVILYAFWYILTQRTLHRKWIVPSATLLVLTYLFAGNWGFYGDKLFVVMSEQADVVSAETISDYNQRRQQVYDQLTATAASQTDLVDLLGWLNADVERFYLVNAIQVADNPLIKLWLSTRQDVYEVVHSPFLRPTPVRNPLGAPPDFFVPDEFKTPPADPTWNMTGIGADRVWNQYGTRGAGIIIGLSDTGVEPTNAEVMDSYRGASAGHDFNWYDPWNSTIQPSENGVHGTSTLSLILGENTGIAPDANWIGCVNLDRYISSPSYYVRCMEFMLAPFPLDGDPLVDGRPDLGAHISNNAWTCDPIEGCSADTLQPAVSAMRSAGIFVVAAAGNYGEAGCGTVQTPLQIYDDVFTVGSLDSLGLIYDRSSRGPVTVDGSGRPKPDIVAPGVDVVASYPHGIYQPVSGTSMASSVAAGAVALLWSARPELIGDIDLTEELLRRSAQPVDMSKQVLDDCEDGIISAENLVGAGFLDIYSAIQMAETRSTR